MKDSLSTFKLAAGFIFCLLLFLTCTIFQTWLPLLVVMALLFMGLVIWRPLIGFCAMILLIPLENLTVLFSSFTLIKFIGIVTFWGWLVNLFTGRKSTKAGSFFVLVALFFLWCLASAAWAMEPEQSINRIISLGQLLIMVFLGYNLVERKRDAYFILGSYLLGAFLAAGLGIYYGYLHEFAVRTDVGNFNDHNFYARLLGLGLLYCGYFVAVARYTSIRLAGLVCFAMLTFAILLSGSRGAWVALLVTLIAGLVLIAPRVIKEIVQKRYGWLSLLAGLILIAVVGVYFSKHLPPVVVQRAQTFTSLADQTDRGSGRLDIWLVGLEIVKHNYLKGVGVNNFPYAYTEYLPQTEGVNQHTGLFRDPHNNYLSTAAELGLPGLLIFLSLFYFAWRLSGRAENAADATLGKLIVIFLIFSGLSSTDHFSKMFWLGMVTPVILAQFGCRQVFSPGGSGGECKTLFISPVFPNRLKPNYGIFALRLVQNLKAAGIHVDVIAPVPYAPVLLWFNKKWRDMGRVQRKETIEGVEILHPRYLCLPGARFGHWNMFLMYWSIYPVIKILNDRVEYDIVHSYVVLPTGYAGLLAAERLRLKTVCTAIGSDINVVPHKSRLLRERARYVLQNTGQIVAVGNELAAAAANIAGPAIDIRVIYEGVDSCLFDPETVQREQVRLKLGFKPGDRVILFVGALCREKGVYELLDAFALLSGRVPGVKLVLVGSGTEQAALTKKAGQMGLGQRVVFAGEQPNRELVWWYAASEIVVLLSYHEGVPNVLKEAMSCGRPVVATKIAGITELVEDGKTGLLVEPGEVEDCAGALEKLLVDDQRRREMGAAGREYAQSRLDWRQTAASYREVYSRVVNVQRVNKGTLVGGR